MPRYSVLLQPDAKAGGYSVSVPLLPGVHTEGETRAEALSNAREAIELFLEDLEADGESVPYETAETRPELDIVEVGGTTLENDHPNAAVLVEIFAGLERPSTRVAAHVRAEYVETSVAPIYHLSKRRLPRLGADDDANKMAESFERELATLMA